MSVRVVLHSPRPQLAIYYIGGRFIMNPKGRKENLKAAHPGNKNALKSGVHSPRRQAEEEKKARRALVADPNAFLAESQLDLCAKLTATVQLLFDDITEQGVSDRDGKQRRQVGTSLRTLEMLNNVTERMRRSLATAAIENNDVEIWNSETVLGRLQAIAADDSRSAGAQVAALRLLLDQALTTHDSLDGIDPADLEFLRELKAMDDEQLDREMTALMVPVTNREEQGPPELPTAARD
jgi:hypothetical protein